MPVSDSVGRSESEAYSVQNVCPSYSELLTGAWDRDGEPGGEWSGTAVLWPAGEWDVASGVLRSVWVGVRESYRLACGIGAYFPAFVVLTLRFRSALLLPLLDGWYRA